MAYIGKLPKGRFEARYRASDGRERSRRFPTKREARAYLDQVGVDRRAGTWHDPRAGRIPLAEWATQWEATTVHLRPSSRARDEAYLRNHVLPRFGPMRLDAIGVLDVQEWVADLSGSGLAPATVHKAYQTLSKVLRGAVDAGLLAQTPCRRIELPRIEREDMRFLAPIEVHDMRHTAVAIRIAAGANPKQIAAWAGHTSCRRRPRPLRAPVRGSRIRRAVPARCVRRVRLRATW